MVGDYLGNFVLLSSCWSRSPRFPFGGNENIFRKRKHLLSQQKRSKLKIQKFNILAKKLLIFHKDLLWGSTQSNCFSQKSFSWTFSRIIKIAIITPNENFSLIYRLYLLISSECNCYCFLVLELKQSNNNFLLLTSREESEQDKFCLDKFV